MRVIFMGTPELAATVLHRLVEEKYDVVLCVTQPDKPVGRKMILTAPPAKVEAEKNGIEVWQPNSLRNEEALQKIASYEPDMIITAAYGKILPQAMLNLPKYGCLNGYRGYPYTRGSYHRFQSTYSGTDGAACHRRCGTSYPYDPWLY